MTIHIEQFIKVLNATEAGETNTNDSYVLVPREYDANHFFGCNRFEFDARINGIIDNTVQLRYELTSRNEQRIYQLGPFCRANHIHSGDVVCIEKRVANEETPVFCISVYRKKKVIIVQKSQGHYIIMRNDMGPDYLAVPHEMGTPIGQNLTFLYAGDFSKRKDSPDKFPHYDVKLGGINISVFAPTDYVEIDCENNSINSIVPFKYYAIDQD